MKTETETRRRGDAENESGEVIARCPRCGEPVRHGRCTNIVKCAYTLPAARLLATGEKARVA